MDENVICSTLTPPGYIMITVTFVMCEELLFFSTYCTCINRTNWNLDIIHIQHCICTVNITANLLDSKHAFCFDQASFNLKACLFSLVTYMNNFSLCQLPYVILCVHNTSLSLDSLWAEMLKIHIVL